MPRDYSRSWLAAAVSGSALLVLGAPFVGQISARLRDVTRGSYATVLAAAVIVSAVVAIAVAVSRIGDRKAFRYGMLFAAASIATIYARLAASGVADVDAAERFHLIEYGMVALLFYKAFRPAGDGSVVVIPLLAGFVIGTLEEWLQWFVPGRVGEVRDVLLNLISVGCGVLFSLGLDPPAAALSALRRVSRQRIAVLAVAALLAFAGFFQSVHLGYDIVDRDGGVFRSRYDANALAALSAQRTQQWRTAPPLTLSPFGREDQYLAEGIAHVRKRNERWSEGNLLAARHENLILERYYAPVLDTPSYLAAAPHRWPPEQRARAEAQTSASPGFMIYDSDALPYPVYTWSRWAFWLVVAALSGVLLRVLYPRA